MSRDPYPFCPACAPLFDRLVYDPQAEPEYELLSTGLMWADEMPLGLCFDCKSQLRFVWGVRASIIRGQDVRSHRYRYLWDGMLGRYPHWPGLRPERSAQTLNERLQRLHLSVRQEIDEITDKMTSSQKLRAIKRHELERQTPENQRHGTQAAS